MVQEALHSGAIRTRKLIGREKEKETLQAAIQDVGSSHLLFVIGKGGIGKTRLLEEIPNLVAQWCPGDEKCVSSGLIDLYDTTKHSSDGIEDAIISGIASDAQHFQHYRAQRQKFEERRAAFIGGGRLAEERQALTRTFIENYNAIAQSRRVVLIFDTVETVQYEDEEVQKIIGQEVTGAEVRSWLIENLGKLQNSAIILAGRADTPLFDDLEASLSVPVKRLDLGGFSEEETLAYFKAMSEFQPEIEELLSTYSNLPRIVHIYTAGRPIMLALTIDLVIHGRIIVEEVFPLSMAEAGEKTGGELKAVRDKIERVLIEETQNIPDPVYPALLRYVGWARKGMSAELLSRLLERRVEECQALLNELRRLSFIKTRPGTELIFFHDEMSALVDNYVLRYLPAEREEFCQKAIVYCDAQIEAATGRLRQDLQVERLYYQLLQNPKKGYESYSALADEAILAREFDFDMRLRDEMLRFFAESQNKERAISLGLALEEIDRESALRWISRWTNRGDYKRARQVVQRIRASEAPIFQILHVVEHKFATDIPIFQRQQVGGRIGERDDLDFTFNGLLFVAGLYMYEGEIAIYEGGDMHGALELLTAPIRLLEENGPDLGELGPKEEQPYEITRWADFLGVSYNHCGFAYARLKSYDRAAESYGKALPYFRWTKNEIQMAQTLNNLAFVYSQRGETRRATRICREGLALRRQLGHLYSIGLSLNTLGLTNIAGNDLDKAEERCCEALKIFESEQVSDAWGTGLACNALSEVLRRLGVAELNRKEPGPDFAASEGHFREAEALLKRSIEIFAPESNFRNPFRLVEAYNELGCTYRDWGDLLGRQGRGDQAMESYVKAEEALRQSLAMTTGEMQSERADDYEDLADVYLRMGDKRKLDEMLQAFDEMIPDEYKIVPGEGIPVVAEPVSEFWLSLGKNSMLRARIAWARRTPEGLREATKQGLLASAYFERYSEETAALDTTIDLVYEQLKSLSFQQLRDLREHAQKVIEEYNLGDVRMFNAIADALGQ
jgi:tetratricopeptide (TPR) repeat protein